MILPKLKPGSHIVRSAAVCDERCWECRTYDRLLPLAFLLGVLGYLLYFLTLGAPIDFPVGAYLRVPAGQTLAQVGEQLKAKHLIRSVAVFEGLVRLLGSDQKIYAGEYFFSGKQDAWVVAERLVSGDYELTPIRMVFYEGLTAKQMADLLAKKVPDFDAGIFLAEGQPKEGYLFPDTYFVLPGEDPLLLLRAMQNNFDARVAGASSTIQKFGKSLPEVIVMASLLEREAADSQSRRIIAGILWRRIAIGMPLQVDAVFPYIIGKNTFQLTKEDLRVDSPYNTYKYKGLPPGPIANPGMSSILAAVTPIKTNYLFYLSDKQGNFHYSATYAGQLANSRKYLGN
ncbi:MAG: endolytic transglycosylase MltG [Patescibacteria group bacterium]|mgnify:CR=1 FL=1